MGALWRSSRVNRQRIALDRRVNEVKSIGAKAVYTPTKEFKRTVWVVDGVTEHPVTQRLHFTDKSFVNTFVVAVKRHALHLGEDLTPIFWNRVNQKAARNIRGDFKGTTLCLGLKRRK